jgi:hypothetical protein
MQNDSDADEAPSSAAWECLNLRRQLGILHPRFILIGIFIVFL